MGDAGHGKGRCQVSIGGVANWAAPLIQGVEHYRDGKGKEFVPGLLHVNLGG